MKLSKQNLTILILFVAVAAILSIKFLSTQSVIKADPVASRIKGPEGAKVNIVEFIDLECPACAQGAKILKEYMEKYPNDIRLQVKYYPLMNVHRHALQVAYYAECMAKQGRFWLFFDPLMAQQAQWSQLVSADSIFDQLASATGANMGQLKTCVASPEVSTSVMAEKSLGRSLGVQSTPTYFINNNMVVGSKSLVEELEKYFPKKT